MESQKYLECLRKIKDVALATVDELGNPQVRIIDIMIVKEDALYFVLSRGKEVYKQISRNPNIALVGMTKDYRMIRLNGVAKKAPQSLLDQVFQDNPSMNQVYPGHSRSILDVFCLNEGYGELFDLSSHPIHRESFALGTAQKKDTGFTIDKTCIQCGTCKEKCPQQCIESGMPYRIIQEQCLHCGLCAEECPVEAVRCNL